MGKQFSKEPRTPSFSERLDCFMLEAFAGYRDLPLSQKKRVRSMVIREYQKPATSGPVFVPPVTKFIPRAVLLRNKNSPEYDRHIVISEKLIYSSQEVPRQTPKRKNRPNLRRRRAAKLREARARMDGYVADHIPTSQMTRRVRISSIAARVEFISSLGLAIASLVDTLKSFIYWIYYAMNSDDFGFLSRIVSYVRDIRPQDADEFSQFLTNIENNTFYLFTVFVYVTLYARNNLENIGRMQLETVVRQFLALEGLSDVDVALFQIDGRFINIGDIVRDVYLSKTLLDLICLREFRAFQRLLNKQVSKELTRIRGIRFFRNVTNTVLSIPIIRLAAGLTSLPESSVTVMEAFYRLTSPPGHDRIDVTQTDEYVRFMSDASRTVNIRNLLVSAENALLRRRGPNAAEPQRFEEIFEEETGEDSGTNNP